MWIAVVSATETRDAFGLLTLPSSAWGLRFWWMCLMGQEKKKCLYKFMSL